jgi:mannose-1-phosphate guanylyltransferase
MPTIPALPWVLLLARGDGRRLQPLTRQIAGDARPNPEPLPLPGEPAFPIRRFWEKPSPTVARKLFERGALWNSFVMVGRVAAFLTLAAPCSRVAGGFRAAQAGASMHRRSAHG